MEVGKEEEDRLERIRTRIELAKQQTRSVKKCSNTELMEILLDNFEKKNTFNTEDKQQPATSAPSMDHSHTDMPPLLPEDDLAEGSENIVPKTQLHSKCEENDNVYLVSGSAIDRLFKHFSEERGSTCKCGESLDYSSFMMQRITKNNHCGKATISCTAGHILEWFTSPTISGKYYANLR